ncbi:MAG: AraC family transcriptional regulator [Gorillibacterium sp.]|nr:AraC family transcriptional regulator [Gorillibacterium sp.]
MEYLRTNVERPIIFLSAGHFVSDIPWLHAKRIIDSYEIIISVNKTLYIAQGGVEYVVRPGEILLLSPDQVHEGYQLSEQEVSFLWLHFRPSGAYKHLNSVALADYWGEQNKGANSLKLTDTITPFYCAPSSIERIHILFKQLQHVVNSSTYTGIAADYIASSLLIELSDQTLTELYRTPTRMQGKWSMSEMIEWTRLHAMEDISVADIAAKFSYNKDYLSRSFKRKTGYHVQEYIHLIRIAKAKDILGRSSRSIRDIAQQVGFHDEKYFMRLFKRYEHITPTEYRQAYYNLHMNNQ